MSDAVIRFRNHLAEGQQCLTNFEATRDDFALRHVWIIAVSSFDWYVTELVSEAGLRLIDRVPSTLTPNLRQVEVPLSNVLTFDRLSPAERLIFFREHIFASIRYKSFYRPEKVSEALSYIWTCPGKEKWGRIIARMRQTGRYIGRVEDDIRGELTSIGDRRDLIAHSVDTLPGGIQPNPVRKEDAARVIEFVGDLVEAIDTETEDQLA